MKGPAESAQLNQPYGLTVSAEGEVYIADSGNHRVVRLEHSGELTLVAGTGSAGLNMEGGPALETPLNFPVDLLLTQNSDLLIADMLNGVIQQVSQGGD